MEQETTEGFHRIAAATNPEPAVSPKVAEGISTQTKVSWLKHLRLKRSFEQDLKHKKSRRQNNASNKSRT